MNRSNSPDRFGGIGVIASVALHAAVTLGFWSRASAHSPTPVPSVVRFFVVEPEKPKPPPPPKPTATIPTREPGVPRPSPVARTLPEREPPPPANAPPPTTAQPLDLSGVTLTNASGVGWSVSTTSEAPAPTAATKSAANPAPQASARPARTEAPVVAAKDLSKHPLAPSLDSQLRNHYPEDARRRGIGGEAVVRARVDPDGRVRTCSVVSESESGFGSACRSTVLGSSWSPPLDREGRPVSTYVRYTCRFRVDG